jgi:cytochrome c oxidase subunit II
VTRSLGRSRPSAAPAGGLPGGGGSRARARGRRRVGLLAALALVGVTATGCDAPNFGFPNPITVQGDRMLNIWQGSFIAALAVGALVLGMILYAVVAFRKKTDEMPRQVRYNLPVEILYTVLPCVIIAGLFYYTARDEIQINKVSKNPDVTVDVIGFRWNWQFIYSDTGKNGQAPIEVTGRPGEPAVLVLPTDRTIKFVETSPDVIHSFWVPAFLFKRDVIPGRINQFQVTINKTGTFIGRCAELCGVDHDRMNFYLKVVTPAQYDSFLAAREAAASASTSSTTGSGQ